MTQDPTGPASGAESGVATATAGGPDRVVDLSTVAPAVPGRLESLDVFRGATIAAMLLVNNPGTWSAIYAPLRHAEWHGWTPTDLIFPFFLFIVGVAMTLSFGKLLERGASRRQILRKATKRAAILFLLGLLLHSFPWVGYDFGQIRIPGVLQRIGLAYFLATPIVLWFGWRGRLTALVALLLGYWALLAWVPVPGVGAGVLEPGQDLGAFIDRAVFGTDHLWSQSRTWDPEGLLGTLPAVGTVLTGVFAGEWLRGARTGRPPRTVALGLAAAGALAIGVGLLWDPAFPINKPLWTSSYVVFTSGMAALSLALCYWLIDVRGHRLWGRPFLFFGVNAIAAYFLSGIFARALSIIRVPAADGATLPLKAWIFQHGFASWLSPINASLAFALAFVLVWTGIVWAMYRRRIFIKV
jgi:predicted acyltransferase